MSEQLARCPFCGSTHFGVYATFTVNGKKFFAQCSRCWASGPAKKTQAKAKRSWNWRTIEHVLRAEIDDLRDSLRNERLFSSKWLHERDAARAELEAYKHRRCAECKFFEENEHRWFSNVNDRCRNEEAYQRETEPDWYCPLWEAKEEEVQP